MASSTTTKLTQLFSTSTSSHLATFAGSSFVIPPNAVKYSISLDSSSAFLNGCSISYNFTADASITLSEQTFDNYTTYEFVDSASSSLIQLDLFGVALVDNSTFQPVSHSIVQSTQNGQQVFTLVLQMPSFNHSLYYDPTIRADLLTPTCSLNKRYFRPDKTEKIKSLKRRRIQQKMRLNH